MKHCFAILLLAFITPLIIQAATGDTTIIVAHTNSNMASPPSDDDIWVVFPNNNTTYQKVIMQFTLGCGTPNCSGWDYTVNTSLGKKNGMLDSTIATIDTTTHDTTWNYSPHVDFVEVGRLITPYGTYMAANSNGFNNNWTHPYYYDITDYAGMLKDSVNVRVHYDGWTDAFSAKVEFIFIEGPPNRSVESVREVYHMGAGYGNSTDFENVVNARNFFIDPSVTSAKVQVIMTGHGSQGEFDPHYFHIKVNGSEVYQHILWKDDCGMNAIAPQGGTWIFNRANWCPGEKVPMYEADITAYMQTGQTNSIDLDFDDFILQSGQGASYGISVYLVTYTSQKENDVMMEEIIAPNSAKPYLHHNPISTTPKVIIKNTGTQNLSYAEISYWVKGGTKWYYEWTGNLPPFESELVTLPAFDWRGDSSRIFYAEVNWPNQKPDEYTWNNILQSSFTLTPKYDSAFLIYFRTNNHPEENWYVVHNEAGDTILFKDTFAANAMLRDTLRLAPGSYSFDIFDYDTSWGCGDGISWWLNQQEGLETSGQILLRKLNNIIIKNFNGDFGSNIHHEFTVGYTLGNNEPKDTPQAPLHTSIADFKPLMANLSIAPNPANDVLRVTLNTNRDAAGTILLTDLAGRIIRREAVGRGLQQNFNIPVATLARGLYVLQFTSGEFRISKKVVLR